jgi:hypothetical protein
MSAKVLAITLILFFPVQIFAQSAKEYRKKALSKILETMSELSMDTIPQGADVQIRDMNNAVIVHEKSPFRKYLKVYRFLLQEVIK